MSFVPVKQHKRRKRKFRVCSVSSPITSDEDEGKVIIFQIKKLILCEMPEKFLDFIVYVQIFRVLHYISVSFHCFLFLKLLLKFSVEGTKEIQGKRSVVDATEVPVKSRKLLFFYGMS